MQSNISDISDMNKFRKIVQGSEVVSWGTLTKPKWEKTEQGTGTINYLSQIHFNKATPMKATESKPTRISRKKIGEWDDDIITNAKVEMAFNILKIKKNLLVLTAFTLSSYRTYPQKQYLTSLFCTKHVYFLSIRRLDGKVARLSSYQSQGKVPTKLLNHGGPYH